jgi:hypothetical protein
MDLFPQGANISHWATLVSGFVGQKSKLLLDAASSQPWFGVPLFLFFTKLLRILKQKLPFGEGCDMATAGLFCSAGVDLKCI